MTSEPEVTPPSPPEVTSQLVPSPPEVIVPPEVTARAEVKTPQLFYCTMG